MRNAFDVDISQPTTPWALRILRPALPYWPGTLAEKTSVRKYRSINCARGRSVGNCGDPLTLGRSKLTPLRELSRPLTTVIGLPVSSVRIPPSSHPPNSRAYHCGPRSSGSSYRYDETQRC